ncbi:P-loop NTPase family protein [Desulfopila aestuarii]|uniref:Molybdopterin-guanine dinucleotide biosynthesis protein B n=1 Tax=Desulfopila aestuarii DSM 18488 TaxID=1121416 RepID=A0A1M7Y3H4_9BACT|nr:hypothetical protein [Desulfopila aestuarii]SHO46749.1 hypothetical protein SAMN02745220_01623 [Desulfopila aestuarii DSM 18488]
MKNLLIVGGTGRNVGKTEFVCRLIAKLSLQTDIYALKVSAIHPDEEIYHGDHGGDCSSLGQLAEESRQVGNKDTIRMLRAGAKRVFYLRSDGSGIEKGFQEFLNTIPEEAAIICESNSLGDVVDPALLIVVKAAAGQVKPRAIAQLERADLVIISDGQSGFPQLEKIDYDTVAGWYLK